MVKCNTCEEDLGDLGYYEHTDGSRRHANETLCRKNLIRQRNELREAAQPFAHAYKYHQEVARRGESLGYIPMPINNVARIAALLDSAGQIDGEVVKE